MMFLLKLNPIAESMNDTITNKIRKTPRITSTITMLVIEEQGGKEEEE